MDQEWRADVNYDAAGGQVILSTENYSKIDLHNRLLKSASDNKIDNLDWLFLVPPEGLSKYSSSTSNISNAIRNFGGQVHELFDTPAKKKSNQTPINLELCNMIVVEDWKVG